MAKNDGGPAFPGQRYGSDGMPSCDAEDGMSLRDYFAIHGPQPMRDDVLRVIERQRLANPHNEPYANKVKRQSEEEIVCALRYQFADAMLAARGQE